MVRARKFDARHSGYRNLAFGFDGGTREAFVVYVLLGAASVLSAGLAYPYAAYRRTRFRIAHARFGRTRFSFRGDARAFYRIYGRAAALAVPLAAVCGLLLQAAFGLFTLGGAAGTPADGRTSG